MGRRRAPSWTGAKGVAPPLPHRGRSGRWAGRRGSHGLFRGAGPVAPGLLPRQVRAACRNAAGLTHQRLLPTCRRPIKRSLPAPPPAPTAACPPDSPPPARLQPSGRAEPSAGRARVGAEVGAAFDPDPAGAGATGRRAGGQSRDAGRHPSRPSRPPSRQGWVPILRPRSLGEVNAHPSLGHRCRGAGFVTPVLRLPAAWQALDASACIARERCPACEGMPRGAAGGGGAGELEKILGGQTSGLEEGSGAG